MKLKEAKEWINSLPENFLEFEMVNAEEGDLIEGETTYRFDKPITSLNVDEANKEIIFLNDKNIISSIDHLFAPHIDKHYGC